MLKRIFTFILLATMVVGYAQAQFSFGAKAGFNLTNMSGDGVDDAEMKPGFQLGLVADYSFVEAFAVQAGVVFAQQGYMTKEDSDNKSKMNLNYLQIPINAMYKFDLGSSMKLFLQAGPYLGYGLNGKIKLWADGKKISSSDLELIGLDDKISMGSGDDDDFKAFDFGIGVGAGLQYNSFQLGVGYNFGLANLSNVSDNSLKNNGLAITLAFLFL